MRKNLMYRLSLAGALFFGTLIAPSVLTSNVMAQDDDDMYFTSSKKTTKTSAPVRTQGKSVTTIISDRAPKIEVYNSNARSDDEYNRRYNYNNGTAQEEQVDTVYDYDINDEETDYLYSRRILRFHSPTRIIISSPYYWDLVYVNGVYDYLYDPFYYDPFYWNWGWGYGCTWGPWTCWYGPMWGYVSPWRPWGPGWGPVYGPVWVGPHFYGPGGTLRYSNSLNRGSFRTANRYGSASSTVRTNALAGTNGNSRGSFGRTSSSIASGSRTNILERGNSINQERNSYTRPSSSRYSTEGGRTVNNTDSRSRVVVNRGNSNSTQVQRSATNNNSNRTTTNRYSTQQTQSRTNSTSTYTPSRSTSSMSTSTVTSSRGSMGGGSMGGGSVSRGGGFTGGGVSRGGGGGGRR